MLSRSSTPHFGGTGTSTAMFLRRSSSRLPFDEGPRAYGARSTVGDSRADSVGESLSRARIHELGFAEPELQVAVETAGHRYVVDFFWPEANIIGEFDGRAKYSRDDFTAGSPPEEVVWREKKREDALRRLLERVWSAGPGRRRWTESPWAECWQGGVPRSTSLRASARTSSVRAHSYNQCGEKN